MTGFLLGHAWRKNSWTLDPEVEKDEGKMALAGLSWLRWVVVFGTSGRILAEGSPWRHELAPLWEFPRCGIPTVGRSKNSHVVFCLGIEAWMDQIC